MLNFNNDCLRNVFILVDVDDLANVCLKFLAIAEDVFRLNHAKVSSMEESTKKLFRPVLCKLGHLIKSIKIFLIREIEFNAIAKYCRPNLEILILSYVTIDCNLLAPFFGQLKSLHLQHCSFIGDMKQLFGNCLQLEKMTYRREGEFNVNFLAQTFPKLQQFLFWHISDGMKLYEALQIKKLGVSTELDDKCHPH